MLNLIAKHMTYCKYIHIIIFSLKKFKYVQSDVYTNFSDKCVNKQTELLYLFVYTPIKYL